MACKPGTACNVMRQAAQVGLARMLGSVGYQGGGNPFGGRNVFAAKNPFRGPAILNHPKYAPRFGNPFNRNVSKVNPSEPKKACCAKCAAK